MFADSHLINFRQENISMAVSEFYIVLNIKSGKDFQTYGKFFLGKSR